MIKRIHTLTPLSVIGHVNCHLIKGDTLSLIDVGTRTPETLAAITFQLKEMGYSLQDIEQVILTHHHPDHVGWTDAFENAEVLAHEYLVDWLNPAVHLAKEYEHFYNENLTQIGVPADKTSFTANSERLLALLGKKQVDHLLKAGDKLPGHEDFIVMETLGHAQSHLAFWNDKTKELIGGDILMYPAESIPSFEAPLNRRNPREKSILQYNDSLRRLQTLPIHVNYSGHGEPIYDMHQFIHERLTMQHERTLRFLPLIKEYGPLTVFELSALIFPKRYLKQMPIILSHTLAHTDYLLDLGLIKEILGHNGVLYYL